MHIPVLAAFFLFNTCETRDEAIKSAHVPFSETTSQCEDISDETCLQFASFNIVNFSSGNASQAQGAADIIENYGFDLMVLQEIGGSAAMDYLVNNYLPGGSGRWSYEIGSSGSGQNVAVLYDTGRVALSGTLELTSANSGGTINDTTTWNNLRLPLYTEVTPVNSTYSFHLLALHLKATGDTVSCNTRQAQVNELNSYIDSLDGHVIVAGDFNDTLPDNGNCTDVDTMTAFEQRIDMLFVTDGAGGAFYMSPDVYTYPSFNSIIDHIYITNTLARYLNPFSDGRRLGVVEHGDSGISDHQPPYIWLRLE